MFRLLATRRFAPIFWVQFFSAFGDNFLKTAMVFVILDTVTGSAGPALVTAAGGLFIAPFFFLSALGGEWADRTDKARLIRRLKLAELGVATIAVAGFLSHTLPLLFAALIGYGVLAALFGPAKYGILPDHLAPEELPAGNALVEGATFVAIVAGAMLAGFAANGGGDPARVGAIVGVLAALCYGASLFVPSTRPADPTLTVHANVFASTAALIREIRADRRLWLLGLYTGWFWFVGAAAMSLLPAFVETGLGGSEAVVTSYLAVFAVAIAVGSGLAAWLSGGRVILLTSVIGTVLMAGFATDLAFAAAAAVPAVPVLDVDAFFARPESWRIGVDLFGLAVGGGLLVVPAFAALQAYADPARRSRMIAASGVVGAGFMILSAAVFGGAQAAGATMGQLFGALALANAVAAVLILRTLPTRPVRDALALLTRVLFRIEVRGLDNLAKAGPNAVVAANHVSFLDAGVVLSLVDRDPVFAIHHEMAQKWWVKPFVRLTRALPVDPTRPLATRQLINAARAGETIVIFPEGRLTVTGGLMKVYDGAGLVADKSGTKVVPVRIEGLEASPLTRLHPDLVPRRRWFPKVVVTVLEPVDLAIEDALRGRARRRAAGDALYGVMSDMMFRTFDTDRTVFEAVADAARIHGRGRVAVEDPVAGPLPYKRLLVGADVLGRALAPLAGVGEAVGVMLPNANAAAVTVLGLMSAGRVPAMVNFTAGPANILSGLAAVEAGTVVTARTFVEKARLGALVAELERTVRVVYLEDVRETIGFGAKLAGLLRAGRPIVRRKADEPAAVLFTSGSEGAPKAVVLSSRNILSNAAQASARIDFGRRDKVFGALPMFHSFGLTAGFVMPVVSGVPVYLYPSPLHYRIVPELVYQTGATILFGTDTFLAGYARTAHPYDLRSLRYVLAGAEPVREATRKAYLETFGLRILEGYGVTETAPVLALNTPMHARAGTVGRLLPGIEARLEPVPGVEEGGRLHVRGPNVMLGIMRADRPGVLHPPAGGWHDTGDIVSIADGYVTIRGRAKRFAKVAGEMVSLAAVEALAADLWPGSGAVVVAVPDERKGERLVLVTDRTDATRGDLQRFARSRGATELMVPAEVMVVPAVPLLGSGKADHAGCARLVAERRTAAAA